MIKITQFFFRIWWLGLLSLFAVLGYLFYSLIWTFRVMQTRKNRSYIFLPLILLISLCSIFYIWFLFFPIPVEHKEVSIIIPKNASIHQIADSLRQHRVITSQKALILYIKITGMQKKVQAGKAKFLTGNGVFSAAKSMTKTITIEYSVTIPEGLTIEQTARKINSVFHSIDTLRFDSLCYDKSFINSLEINAPSLEGFLYPETYFFPGDVNAQSIIVKMVNSFKKCYSSLVPDSQITAKFNQLQIITIASIVEREATLPIEQPRISSVFHNRLRIGYPLGADPTVRYALKKFNGPLTVSDLNTSSPYNTRKYTGLPPGPICSPGKGALQAAISPAKTKDLYFVAKWDGSGEHDFSLTNEEHNRKKLIIRKYNEQRKKQSAKIKGDK